MALDAFLQEAPGFIPVSSRSASCHQYRAPEQKQKDKQGVGANRLCFAHGNSSSAAVTFDGYEMAKQGRAVTAISASATASSIGSFLGGLFLIAISPILVSFVLLFGSCKGHDDTGQYRTRRLRTEFSGEIGRDNFKMFERSTQL